MNKPLLISLFLFVLPQAALAKKSQTLVHCEAYCKFHDAKLLEIRRELLNVDASSTKKGWKQLQAECAKLGKGELHIHNPNFTPCGDSDSTKDCAEPEFLKATKDNVCLVN